MKKYIFTILILAAFACSEDDAEPKTGLESEWYFEHMFPLHARFVIDENLSVSTARVNYYTISEADRTINTTVVNGADAKGFTSIVITGSNYRFDIINGSVRAKDPRFTDVERVEFTAPNGQVTILQNIALKRIK